MKKKVNLYYVNLIHRKTGEKVELHVWAEHTGEATHKCASLYDPYTGEYQWMGSGPIYENNKLVSKVIEKQY